MKNFLLVSSLMLSTSLLASTVSKGEIMSSFTVEEVSAKQYKSLKGYQNYGQNYNPNYSQNYGQNYGLGITGGFAGGGTPVPNPGPGGQGPGQGPGPGPTPYPGGGYSGGGYSGGGYSGGGYSGGYNDPIDTAGRVISVARDFVALGEAIYELASKGKPHNVTEYAPISVVPKDPTTKEPADLFDLEGFSMPVEKNYVATIKDGFGKEAVKFSYKVLYSYGGSYNGTGKYLTNVIIIPGNIVTKYGWDFSASMRLSGMMNHGTKANPVAGIMVTVKYQMNSWSRAYERNDTIHITGNGELKTFMTE